MGGWGLTPPRQGLALIFIPTTFPSPLDPLPPSPPPPLKQVPAPPPPRTRISWEGMKFTKGNIDLGYFWYTNFWTFGFKAPPPAPPPFFKQNSGRP